jgi:tetratricopeptide (TPR) repeat protein
MDSRQLEKAAERFKRVIRLQPGNPEAILLLADVEEQMGNKQEAIGWYEKLLPLIRNPELKKEVENRIGSLKK